MPAMKLSRLLYNLYDTPLYTDPEITGLSVDSRNVQPGDLFFACKGVRLDGREFIEEAIQKGAHAVLAETSAEPNMAMHSKNGVPIFPVDHLNQRMGEIVAEFYGNPSKKLKVIGITGTNGKTSCSYFIAEALNYLNIPCGVIGTLGSGFLDDVKMTGLTTPDAITLQATLGDFVKEKAKAASIEVSSHSIEQGRINSIHFETAIFTNLTRDHLDYHGSMEAYGAAKKKLFDNPLTKNAVINIDDSFGQSLLQSLNKKSLVAYSLKETKSDVPLVYADNIDLDLNGISANVFTPWGNGKLFTPLVGEFNLSNVLAVLATLGTLEIPLDQALASIKHLTPVPGRMQKLGGKNKPLVVVDYAHTPDALQKVLMALRAHCTGKLYCLFGCGGDRDKGKRPLMAKMGEEYADYVLVTDDNPRNEDPEQIVMDIMQGFAQPKKITIEHDRSKAIRDIIHYAGVNDCVLIAGKGAETFQQIGTEKIPFSDVEKVRDIFKQDFGDH